MKTKILRNLVLSVGVFFALARSLGAGMNECALNFSNTPLVPPRSPASSHSMLRAPVQAPVRAPMLSPSTRQGRSQGTIATRIMYSTAFFAPPKGNITTVDAPGAGTGSFQGTTPFNINPARTIAGFYLDGSNVYRGFLRATDGTITTFDAPGAGTGPNQGTSTGGVDCLNPAGKIVGSSLDANNVYHGYVRTPDGTITVFDVLGAGTGPGQGTLKSGTKQERLREPTLTQAMCFTDSCAPRTVLSPRSTFPVRALVQASAPSLVATIPRTRSRDGTLTPAVPITVSCEVQHQDLAHSGKATTN